MVRFPSQNRTIRFAPPLPFANSQVSVKKFIELVVSFYHISITNSCCVLCGKGGEKSTSTALHNVTVSWQQLDASHCLHSPHSLLANSGLEGV